MRSFSRSSAHGDSSAVPTARQQRNTCSVRCELRSIDSEQELRPRVLRDLFCHVTSDGSDDGDDGSNDDGDVPSPSRRNRQRDDDGDGSGLRTVNQWMTVQ